MRSAPDADETEPQETAPPEPESTSTDEPDEKQATQYENVEQWVHGFVLPHFRRNPAQHRWSPEWYQYTEVLTVFEGLWEHWENAYPKGAAEMLDFMKDRFYPMMEIITGKDGPFWAYEGAIGKTDPPKNWPVTTAPEDDFRGRDHPAEQG